MSQTPTKPDSGSPPGVPRWVKVFGIIFIALILLVIILHLTGNNLGCPPPGAGHIPPGCPKETPSGDTGSTPLWSLVLTPTVEHGLQHI